MNAYDALRYALTQISTKPQTLTTAQQLAGDPLLRLVQPTGMMSGRDF